MMMMMVVVIMMTMMSHIWTKHVYRVIKQGHVQQGKEGRMQSCSGFLGQGFLLLYGLAPAYWLASGRPKKNFGCDRFSNTTSCVQWGSGRTWNTNSVRLHLAYTNYCFTNILDTCCSVCMWGCCAYTGMGIECTFNISLVPREDDGRWRIFIPFPDKKSPVREALNLKQLLGYNQDTPITTFNL